MFYCEPYGKCEMCDNQAVGNDRASSTLPLPEPTPLNEDGRFQELLARLQERLNRL